MIIHYMLDLETLSTQPDAVVLSIGMVAFTSRSNDIINSFYQRVSLDDQISRGATVDASTLDWWAAQPDEARTEALSGGSDRCSPWDAMARLTGFFDEQRPAAADLRVWANAPSFDCVILRRMASRANQHPIPWTYREERCYRTIRENYPSSEPSARTNCAHRAIDDAMFQARHLMAINQEHPRVLA
jgi:hypothetical protein